MSVVPKLLAVICLAASITVAGCAAKTARQAGNPGKSPVEYCQPGSTLPKLIPGSARTTTELGVVTEVAAAPVAAASDSTFASASVPASAASAEYVPTTTLTASLSPLDRLFFDFDSYLLTPSARSTLDLIYDKLAASDRLYTLEGYCDERGDDDYNLALGERRAAAARAYRVSRGIAAERLMSVSYGREFPADTAGTEDAYQRNRRVEVVDAEAPGPDSEMRYGVRK